MAVYDRVPFLGRFQYALLHRGQITGTSVVDRATQMWPQRSHCQPSSLIFATPLDFLMKVLPNRWYFYGIPY